MADVAPRPAPPLDIPASSSCVELAIIDTSTRIVCPTDFFVRPVMPRHEHFNMPTFCFHIRNPASGKEILFDLGARKDYWNLSQPSFQRIKNVIRGLDIARGVDEILEVNGTSLDRISSLVVSHWHWDHVGDPSLFPKSTELVVGPGFRDEFMPGYPADPDASLLETDFAGREVRELAFDPKFKIGGLEAFDFFGDGSFYVLNAPGHAIGHISALARTTPDTFCFLGGDICHFGGMFRPTEYTPMPAMISDAPLDLSRFRLPCPCSMFTEIHRDVQNAQTKRYFDVTKLEGSWYTYPDQAQDTIDRLEVFDADPRVFVCIAHDGGLVDVVDFFPTGSLNAWKEKGWKEKSRWGFLNGLPVGGKEASGWFVPGLMKDGQLLKD